jgi:glycosyltransferase involved in cell wall biosynthesis
MQMNNAGEPLVSVITPVYNGAEYLAECIESVLSQTYQNWEYIIVDNCSTDGTRQIAHSYARKDQRIRVHANREFLSPIANHNNALRQISTASEYCKVVFGDDWLFPECLEKMVAVAEEYPSIGLVSAYALKGSEIACDGLPYGSRFVSGREICRRHLLEKLYVFGSATTLLYRAQLVRDRECFYNEANIHADTEACFDLLRTSDFGFVHQVLTFSRVRSASLREMSNDLQTNLAGTLHTLSAYGSSFLNEDEFDMILRQHVAKYYKFLGKSCLLRRDKRFWAYHRKQLADSPVGYSPFRLLMGVLTAAFAAVLDPAESLSKLLKRNRKQQEAPPGGSPYSDNNVDPLKMLRGTSTSTVTPAVTPTMTSTPSLTPTSGVTITRAATPVPRAIPRPHPTPQHRPML